MAESYKKILCYFENNKNLELAKKNNDKLYNFDLLKKYCIFVIKKQLSAKDLKRFYNHFENGSLKKDLSNVGKNIVDNVFETLAGLHINKISQINNLIIAGNPLLKLEVAKLIYE